MKTCKRCDKDFHGYYCPICGAPSKVNRIDAKYIYSEIGSVLNFEKGILYTVRELIIRPGINIRKFLSEDRNQLVKPVIFLIITSLIYTIMQQWLRFEDGYVNASISEDSAVSTIFIWVQQNYGYANIIMALFISFWVKVFFKKYKYNFFEILILLCYVMGIGMLLYTIFGITESFTGLKVLQIGSILGFIYVSWAIGRFFDKRKKLNFLKGFLSYILGMLSFTLVAFALGNVIDFLK